MLPTVKRVVHQLVIVCITVMMLIHPDTTRAASRPIDSPIETRVNPAPISDFPHCTDWAVALIGTLRAYTTDTLRTY